MRTELRVLVADHNNDRTRRYLAVFLPLECAVVTASEGIECREALRLFRPDILILDDELRWGGSDGVLELLSHEASEGKTTPLVVFQTNRPADASLLTSPLNLVCLPKPVTLDSLSTAIRNGLAASRAIPDTAPEPGESAGTPAFRG